MDMLGRVCGSTFSITGSYQQSLAQPADVEGCWGVGTWTFSAKVESNDCTSAPAVLPMYQFKVDETTDADGNPDQTFTYMTDPSVHNRVKISGNGIGCEGELDLFSADGTQVYILKPELPKDAANGAALSGDGEFWIYKTDQWIQ